MKKLEMNKTIIRTMLTFVVLLASVGCAAEKPTKASSKNNENRASRRPTKRVKKAEPAVPKPTLAEARN
jgi:hypothetical protein